MKAILRTALTIVIFGAVAVLLYASFIIDSPALQAKSLAVAIIAALPEIFDLYDNTKLNTKNKQQ